MSEKELVTELDRLILKNHDISEINELNPFTDLITDLAYNSLAIIQLIVQIEEKFELIFPEEYLDLSYVRQYKWLMDFVVKEKLHNEQ